MVEGCVRPLPWRHNERDDVSNHRHFDCLLNHLFRRRSKKTSKLRVTGLCEGNHRSPVPSQRASNTENVSIWWRHNIWSQNQRKWDHPVLTQESCPCCLSSSCTVWTSDRRRFDDNASRWWVSWKRLKTYGFMCPTLYDNPSAMFTRRPRIDKMHIWQSEMVIAVPADSLAPNSAGISAGRIMISKLNAFFFQVSLTINSSVHSYSLIGGRHLNGRTNHATHRVLPYWGRDKMVIL